MGQPLWAPKAVLWFRVPRRHPRRPSVGSAFSEDLPLGTEPRSHGATSAVTPSRCELLEKAAFPEEEGSHAGKCGPAWLGDSSDLPLPALSSLPLPLPLSGWEDPAPWDGSPRFGWAAQAAHGPWGRSLGPRDPHASSAPDGALP